MKKSHLLSALCACISIVSIDASAEIISLDWQAGGDNLITRDTTSGLEWLDLTATSSRSYNDISAEFGSGQEFDGWRYATQGEVSGLLDAFGGDSAFYYVGWSTQNNGLFDSVAPFWGDLWCANNGCTPGDGYALFITAESPQTGSHNVGNVYDLTLHSSSELQDFILLDDEIYQDDVVRDGLGSALVRNTTVPIPAAVWLIGLGLLGLIGISRRKK